MSNRSDLAKHRAALHDLESDLRGIELRCANADARNLISRARAMVSAANGLLTDALRQPVDGFADARRANDTANDAAMRRPGYAVGTGTFKVATDGFTIRGAR